MGSDLGGRCSPPLHRGAFCAFFLRRSESNPQAHTHTHPHHRLAMIDWYIVVTHYCFCSSYLSTHHYCHPRCCCRDCHADHLPILPRNEQRPSTTAATSITHRRFYYIPATTTRTKKRKPWAGITILFLHGPSVLLLENKFDI